MMIRIAQKADLPAILAIYGPYIIHTTATFEYDIPSPEAFESRFDAITAQFPWLVWEEEGRILGYAYAAPPYTRAAYAWCAEPSVYLLPEARGRGIGKKLYAALEEILRCQGYQVLYALITGENTASLHFHERCGYTFRVLFPDCGFKFGRWIGVIWMDKPLYFVDSPSNFPTPWPAIMQSKQSFSDILDILSLF